MDESLLNLLPEIQSAAFNLSVALFCGALIGTERQARKRTAGLRTNALVAIGAAAFVIFAARFTDEASPTRVAAQVVSGIGFLGAGIIFRDGFNVHGINTAATLWCSAAVGLMAGSGAWHLALLLMGFVVFVNLGMRPFVKWLKRKIGHEALLRKDYQVIVRCRIEREEKCRNLIVKCFGNDTLSINSMSSQMVEASPTIEFKVAVSGYVTSNQNIESAVLNLVREPDLLHVSWNLEEDH